MNGGHQRPEEGELSMNKRNGLMILFVCVAMVPVTAPLLTPPGGSLPAFACDPSKIQKVSAAPDPVDVLKGISLAISQSRATTYRYDDLNRLVEIIHADGTRITYTYDAAGNLMQTVTRPR
jgi:YD repeat-containing protein